MEISKALLGGTILATLLIGVGVGYGLTFLTKSPSMVSAGAPVLPKDRQEEVKLQQDGKEISLENFFSVFRENPNRFNIQAAKSKFVVEGKISEIGEFNDLTNKISGFHIPLKHPRSNGPRDLLEPTSVSVFVKGLTVDDVASFDVGDPVKFDCPNVRAFNDSLVFDDCSIQGELK